MMLDPPLDVFPVPEPRASDHYDRRGEVSGLLGVQEALAGLPADELEDLACADEIGGIDLLALGPTRHGPDYRRPRASSALALDID